MMTISQVKGCKWVGNRRAVVWLTCSVAFFAVAAPAARAQPVPSTQPDTSCRLEIERIRTAANAKDSATALKTLVPCTDTNDEKNRRIRLDQTDAEALRLARMFFDIPEYHDEGRLPVNRDVPGALLGPLAGIYASPFLHGFTRPAQIYEQGKPGILAAIVVVDEKPGVQLPPSYRNLQLQAGMNCIWLYVEPPSAGGSYAAYLANLRYSARLSHPASGGACDRSVPMPNSLAVVAVTIQNFTADSDYPPVARFATDRQGNPILAFRCLNAFCEIGVGSEKDVRKPDGLGRPNPNIAQWDPAAADNPDQGRRQVIKGWHDEQTLAVRGADYRWRASDVTARITPIAGAAQYDSADFHNQWRRVARILIVGAVPTASKYHKWGLRTGVNHIEFQYDGAAGRWKAQLVRPDTPPVPWNTMVRIVHHDVAVPPIVRFRWTGADDGVWAPCGNACCKTDGTQ